MAQPSPGPPGSISGQILFPPKMNPSPLAVYAVEGVSYVMTKVLPPARSYHLDVPPGNYQVVARLDADPLSSAGYVTCQSSGCFPVMTRAGYVTCQAVDCQPLLNVVRVDASRNVTNIDIGGWRSLRALEVLWSLDQFGTPGPWDWQRVSSSTSPTARPQLSWRELPSASSETLTAVFGVPNTYDGEVVDARLHLPTAWRHVANPAASVEGNIYEDYANQPVRSPLALASGGIWLTVSATDFCSTLPAVDGTARAEVNTSTGASIFYFEDPHGPVGPQPFSGYAFWGVTRLDRDTCLTFRFTTLSDQSRETNLPTFIAIIQQAQSATS